MKRCIWIVLFATLFIFDAYSQQKTYVSRRLEGKPPVIDGLGDDAAWNGSEWGSGFLQREPFEGKEPGGQTSFKIIYDDDNIYVLIRAHDRSPDSIVRRLSRRDEFDGDWVGIQIDSYEDKQTAFSFSVTAAGVKIDEAITNDNNTDGTWNAVWYAKVSADAEGWLTEMRIPLSQLRFAKKAEYHWGVQVMRQIFRKNEFSVWSPMPREKSQWVRLFGTLDGIKGIAPRRDIEILPYVVAKAKSYQEDPENPYAPGKEIMLNGGVDGKIGITNDLTLNFSVNPDFGQVEADPSEVNLTAFESYFSEKRPFFVEGKNIFSFQLTDGDGGLSMDNLFYSRRIGHRPHHDPESADDEYIRTPEETTILGAFKLSGKTKQGWSIGILESFTQKEVAKIGTQNAERTEAVEPFTNYFLARTTKDFNKGQQIVGAMFTATHRDIQDSQLEFLTDAAYSGGANFTTYTKNRHYELGLKTGFSHVTGSREAITGLQESSTHYFQRPDHDHKKVDTTRTSLTGTGGTVSFSKIGGGKWRFMAWLTWRSPELELNDAGFLRQSDEIQQVLWAQYRILEPFSIFRNIFINMNQWKGFDYFWAKTYGGGNINLNAEFKNSWYMATGMNREDEAITRSALRGGPRMAFPGGWSYWGEIGSDSRKKVQFSIGHNAFHGDHQHFINQYYGIGVRYRPSNAVSIRLDPGYSYSRDKLQYVETVDYNNGSRYIMAGLDQHVFSASIRVNINLGPDMTIQYWGQPFLFAGNYRDFKYAANTLANNFTERFHLYAGDELSYDAENDSFDIDENKDGIVDYSIDNPDFNFFQFRSNLVFRWEFIPGSTMFLVWSQGRTGSNELGDFDFNRGMKDLYRVYPEDVALLKISYRFVF